MHGHGKSDSSIVLAKPPNEAVPEAKDAVEGRGLAKGKTRVRWGRFKAEASVRCWPTSTCTMGSTFGFNKGDVGKPKGM